jgi:hypothetical protein
VCSTSETPEDLANGFKLDILRCQYYFKREEWLLPPGFVARIATMTVNTDNIDNSILEASQPFLPSDEKQLNDIVDMWQILAEFKKCGFSITSGPLCFYQAQSKLYHIANSGPVTFSSITTSKICGKD